MVISEADYQVYVHELRLAPKVELHQIAKLPSPEPNPAPEPEAEHRQEHFVVAAWAEDASAVLLQYQDSLLNHYAKYQVSLSKVLKQLPAASFIKARPCTACIIDSRCPAQSYQQLALWMRY